MARSSLVLTQVYYQTTLHSVYEEIYIHSAESAYEFLAPLGNKSEG